MKYIQSQYFAASHICSTLSKETGEKTKVSVSGRWTVTRWQSCLFFNTQATCCSAQPSGQEPSVGCWPRVRGSRDGGGHRCTDAHTWHFKGALLQDNLYFLHGFFVACALCFLLLPEHLLLKLYIPNKWEGVTRQRVLVSRMCGASTRRNDVFFYSQYLHYVLMDRR